MNEKVQINIETTKQELVSKAYQLLTAISTMAESIECLSYDGPDADLEADVLEYTSSIKALSEIAQMCVFHVSGEI